MPRMGASEHRLPVQVHGQRSGSWAWKDAFKPVFRKDFVHRKTLVFERRLEEGEGTSHSGFRGRRVPGSGNIKCKGRELGTCLVCPRDTRRPLWLHHMKVASTSSELLTALWAWACLIIK